VIPAADQKATLVPRARVMGIPVAGSPVEAGTAVPGVEQRGMRAMLMLRVAIGLIWAVSFVAGRQAWISPSPLANAATSAEITAPATPTGGAVAGESLVESGDSGDTADPRFDLFGNEVEEAVADYRIDLRGGLYERHSPDTAVPRLGSPIS
jgi:hypothetical protein